MTEPLPPLTDHAFWALVRKRLQDFSKSLPQIADELGVDCKQLTDAWLVYKAPRELPKVAVPTYTGGRSNRDSAGRYLDAQRFQAYRKAHEGATETRRMLEAQRR